MPYDCPICKSAVSRSFAWRSGYRICHCNECDLLFSDPMPTEEQLQEFYQGFLYRQPDVKAISGFVDSKKPELKRLFAWNESELAGKTLLDFGGGTGITYAASQQLGLDTSFYEIDEKAIGFVAEHFGLKEDRTYRSCEELPKESFDFIIADNVIEHDTEPLVLTQRLYSLLRPGGTMVIKTPNARNTEIYFYPMISIGWNSGYSTRTWKYDTVLEGVKTFFLRRWHCDPPRHVYSLSKPNLQRLAEDAKIEDYSIEYYRLPLFAYSLTKKMMTRPGTSRGWIFRFISWPLLPLEWVSKIVQVGLTSLGLLSPGGIILKARCPG